MKKIILSLFLVSNFAFATDYVSGKKTFIDGYDPVAYQTLNTATKGNSKHHHSFDGVKIFFASEENKNLFIKSPKQYMPAYKGWCAYAMAQNGKLVDVDPTSFKVTDGKLYLFYKAFWADTLKKWEKAPVKPQIELANKNWIKNKY